MILGKDIVEALFTKKQDPIDKIITINQRVSEVSTELKNEKYDYILDLHKNLRSLFVKLHLFNVHKLFLHPIARIITVITRQFKTDIVFYNFTSESAYHER